MAAEQHPARITWLGLWICVLGSIFYVYDFFVRVSPSVMTSELMRDLHVYAPGLGLISSILFFTYTLTQIPAGLLIDRFGVKMPLVIATFACALATLAFAYTSSAWVAGVMFGIIGLTAGFAYVAAVVLAARWFPPHYFTIMVGWIQFIGCIGAITAQTPLHLLTLTYGWRHAMAGTAVVGFILGIIYIIWLRDAPYSDMQRSNHLDLVSEFKAVYRNLKMVMRVGQNWWIAVFTLLVWTPMSVFTSLWGVPALKAMFHLKSTHAATLCSVIWIGVAIGSPAFGWLTDRGGRRCFPALLAGLCGLGSTVLLLLLPSASFTSLAILLFMYGVASSGQAVSYGFLRDINPDEVVGTAIGLTNMLCILGTPIFQPLISFTLQHLWTGHLFHDVPIYSSDNYRYALLCVPLLYLTAILVAKFALKETYCQRQYDITGH